MDKLLHFVRKRNDKVIFTISILLISTFVLLPVFQVVIRSFGERSLYLNTLIDTGLLTSGIINTFLLVLKTGLIASILGFGSAYIMTFYHIRFKHVINILLIIPLGIPVYVAAYTYTNIFYDLPFLESILKSDFLMGGAVFIYAFFLFPYVYIASKSYLQKHLTEYIEAARTLRSSPMTIFFRIILPLSRPVIIGSVLFVVFETLSDFAVVEYYGQLTLSRYINIAWFNQGDISTASKFAIYILFMMFMMITLERFSRKNKKYTNPENTLRTTVKQHPKLVGSVLIYSFLFILIGLSSILPISEMIQNAWHNQEYIERLDLPVLIYNTLLVTSISIVAIITVSMFITTIVNYLKGFKKKILSSVLVMGYSIPSMVLALGVYLMFIRFDKWIYPFISSIGINKMLVTSSIFIIVFGFFFKFFSIGFSNLTSAYKKIDPHLLEVSETLGENKLSTMFRVNIPLLSKSVIGISIILFIDMVKELTLVYSLRPFNFKTLSTEVYRYAGNEMIEVAAFPSLIIILLCTLLIIYLEVGREYVKNRKS